MAQSYRELLGSDLFGDSYGYLNNSTRANRTLFSGTTEPAAPEAYQLWADTTAGLLKMRTGANDGWISLGTLGSDFLGLLSRAGGIMAGTIDMGGFSITNVGLGTGAAAARQQEVDAKAPIAAPAFTGDAQVNQDPFGNNSLIRRIWAEGRYAKLSGATMTGSLNLAGNASLALEAVPRQQLAAFTDFNTGSGHRHNGTDARKVLATDLDAAGSSSGQVPVSTGSGTPPAWTGFSAPLVFLSEVNQVFDTNSAIFTTVDVSASVPSGAIAVILSVAMNSGYTSPTNYFTATLKVRKTGTTPTNPATYQQRTEEGDLTGLTIPFTVIAEVDSSRRFDYSFTGGGTTKQARVNGKLVGYFARVI